MCLRYSPTIVACVCIHLACKWSKYKIPLSAQNREWFKYVDSSVTLELLETLTEEFLTIFEQCPSRLKRKIMASTQATKEEEERRAHNDVAASSYQPDLSVHADPPARPHHPHGGTSSSRTSSSGRPPASSAPVKGGRPSLPNVPSHHASHHHHKHGKFVVYLSLYVLIRPCRRSPEASRPTFDGDFKTTSAASASKQSRGQTASDHQTGPAASSEERFARGTSETLARGCLCPDAGPTAATAFILFLSTCQTVEFVVELGQLVESKAHSPAPTSKVSSFDSDSESSLTLNSQAVKSRQIVGSEAQGGRAQTRSVHLRH